MNSPLKSRYKITPGTIIKGKWHQSTYKVIKEIGSGANGIVYLAQSQPSNRHVALKMSDNGMAITSEVNVLKSFEKVQGSSLGPSLIDVDDWVQRNRKISFYVMEYLQGPDLLTFIKKKGHSWTGVLMLQLLSDLHKLHQNGWVFGDLKPENLIVVGPPTKIRIIDVGGTTIQGRAIKEFTEFYDRGYWGLGTRKAEPTYDLFAAGMIMINTAYPKRFPKTIGGVQQLQLMIKQKRELRIYNKIIIKAIKGHYYSAMEMRNDLLDVLKCQNTTKESATVNQTKNTLKNTPKISRQVYKKKKKRKGIVESLLILLVISFLYFLYLFEQIM